MNWIVVQLASIWAIIDVKTRSPTTSQLLRKTQQNIKDHPTHLFHDLVATSEVEALLQQASPHYKAQDWGLAEYSQAQKQMIKMKPVSVSPSTSFQPISEETKAFRKYSCIENCALSSVFHNVLYLYSVLYLHPIHYTNIVFAWILIPNVCGTNFQQN